MAPASRQSSARHRGGLPHGAGFEEDAYAVEGSERRPEPSSVVHAIRRPGAASPRDVAALGGVAGNRAVAELVGPTVQRAGWGAEYKTRRARPGALPYEEYKARIGQPGESEAFAPSLKAASEWGGTPLAATELSRDELGRILLPEKASDPDAVAAHEQRLDAYLPDINAAFEIMAIDTVEAQADYLAHTAGESGTLAKLKEVGAEKRPYAPFQGRGPVQVTFEAGYVQTLAYLETQAERLEAKAASEAAAGTTDGAADAAAAPDGAAGAAPGADVAGPSGPDVAGPSGAAAQAALARRAVDAIRKDPEQAASPEFAFLFSAAFMHMAGGVRSSARLGQTASFAGNSSEDRWVTGRSTTLAAGLEKAIKEKDTAAQADMRSTLNRAKVKRETYERAVQVLWPRRVLEATLE